MFNLNPEKFSFLDQHVLSYTTLEDASFRWNEYLGQTSDQVKRFQNQRCLKSSQIIEILQEIQEKYNSSISEIINKVKIQYQMFSLNEINEFTEDMNFEMSTKQVNELTEILSKKDKFQVLAEKQLNIQKEDLNQLEIISNNFGKLLQNDLLATERINKIFKDLSSNFIIRQSNFKSYIDETTLHKQEKESLKNQLTERNQQIINDFKKNDAEQIKLIQDLRKQNEGQSIKIKELEQQKTQCEVIVKEKQAELQICQQQNQKLEEMLKQLQQTLVQDQQFSQSLTFSTTYKNSNCSVSQNGKVIETSCNGWQCCMCDQMIPKNGLIQFAIKIIEINLIMIGIGFRDIVQSKNYSCCHGLGGGTYNIYYNGQCYNHDQQDKSGQQIAFPFSTNDIIIVEVDIQKKQIKWTKQSTNQSFTLNIDISKELYPCVHLQGRCKVEILNQGFK
ncbi:unnamed protein product [Paramecium primaurelia]|uniref:B30.2/SPRY domain-containing protein n=1 Tax=Paramecium primaurelia TaxID=5886 RepID=A0A8S1PSB4_PARPR|nr:unnamed protein product [Paramecium primaurelia]